MNSPFKKIVFISIQFLIVMLVLSCSKNEDPNPEEVAHGKFWGEIGSDGYNLVNDKSNHRMQTTHFDGKNYQFKFAVYDSSNPLGNVFKTDTELTVNLTDALNSKLYATFETYADIKDYSKDWIHLYYYKLRGNDEDKRVYTTVKEKHSIDVNILSIEYRDLKVPSIKGNMKGYLYNVENAKDSIYIKADFITQASY
jgi:hypothetical protein